MKHNRHKKQSLSRKRFEHLLISDLRTLSAQGSFFDSCIQKDAKDKKFKIAKKRYTDLLDHAENTIKKIKDITETMEKESIKEQKRAKLIDQDEKRNKKIRGEEEDEEN